MASGVVPGGILLTRTPLVSGANSSEIMKSSNFKSSPELSTFEYSSSKCRTIFQSNINVYFELEHRFSDVSYSQVN